MYVKSKSYIKQTDLNLNYLKTEAINNCQIKVGTVTLVEASRQLNIYWTQEIKFIHLRLTKNMTEKIILIIT